MPEHFVIDACSLIAFFREEAGEENVSKLFKDANAGQVIIFLHKITATEVLYDMVRSDKINTNQLLQDIYRLPVIVTDILSDDFIKLAAQYKAFHKISFADCFVLALAEINNAAVVTADHHEFDPVEKSGKLKFEWIR